MNKKIKISIIAFGILAFLIAGYFALDSILFDGIRPRTINENGFQANLYASDTIQNKPAIILVGGGQWGDYWGQEFAKKGWVGLSLPYYRREGLPDLPEEIPLEYFEKAIKWLEQQPSVDGNKIIVMGASRNAELSLTIAATLPHLIHGAIAYAPSAVSWSNTVLPYNSDSIKPSWTYKNEPIPFIRMEKIKGNDSGTLETLEYWKEGLSDSAQVLAAAIKIEKINGPILLFSGKDDQVWPSAFMSDMMEERVKTHGFSFSFSNFQYKNAGHLISGNPDFPSSEKIGQMMVDGKNHKFNLGGTIDGDQLAQLDAKEKVFEFISNL